jgi:hypothetical protein
MDHGELPLRRFLHGRDALNPVKLAYFRRIFVELFAPGKAGVAQSQANGTILDGHHRVPGVAAWV